MCVVNNLCKCVFFVCVCVCVCVCVLMCMVVNTRGAMALHVSLYKEG